MIHNHYKALVLKSEAEKYWKLTPEVVKEGNAADSKADGKSGEPESPTSNTQPSTTETPTQVTVAATDLQPN